MELLKDSHARTLPMLAEELDTDITGVFRLIEYLEHIGMIRRVIGDQVSCHGCSGCTSGSGGKMCGSCLPEGGFKNMGQMWEVVART